MSDDLIRVEGTEQFTRLALVLKAADDGKLISRRVGAAMRATARPLGKEIARAGGDAAPHSGGLADRIRASTIGVTASLTSRNPKVALRLKTREGYDLAAINAGDLRHPVFARDGVSSVWVSQKVHAGAFTAAFEAGAVAVRREALVAAESVLAQIAAET